RRIASGCSLQSTAERGENQLRAAWLSKNQTLKSAPVSRPKPLADVSQPTREVDVDRFPLAVSRTEGKIVASAVQNVRTIPDLAASSLIMTPLMRTTLESLLRYLDSDFHSRECL